jgi:hypothetical protein
MQIFQQENVNKFFLCTAYVWSLYSLVSLVINLPDVVWGICVWFSAKTGTSFLSITSRHSVDPTQPALCSRGTRGVFAQAKKPEVWNLSLSVIQGSWITNHEKLPAASPSFWSRCKHNTWVTNSIYQTPTLSPRTFRPMHLFPLGTNFCNLA